MPKTESDYTEEIKIRASKEFVDMYDRYSSRDQYRGLILGHKNLTDKKMFTDLKFQKTYIFH